MFDLTTLNGKKYAFCCSVSAQLSLSDYLKDVVHAE